MKWASILVASLGLAACVPHSPQVATPSQGKVRAAPRKDLPAFPTVKMIPQPMAPVPPTPVAPAVMLPQAPRVDQSNQN